MTRHFPFYSRIGTASSMRRTAASIVFLCILTSGRVVASAPSDPDSSSDTLQMNTADAAVLILLEEETFEIKNLREAYLDYRIKKRILQSVNQEEGIFSFPERKDLEILSIEANAVYPDGREETLDRDDTQSVPDFPDFALYGDQRTRVFGFPRLQPGTEIDVRIRYRIKNLVLLNPIFFQTGQPILRRSYTLIHPADIDVNIHAVAMDASPDRTSDIGKGRKELVWERGKIEPFEGESDMPPIKQFIPALRFSVSGKQKYGEDIDLSSWNGIVNWYLALTRESLEPDDRVRNLSLAYEPDETARARAIYHTILDRLRYVAIYLGIGGHKPHSCEEVLEHRYGDCKDQSVAMTAVMRESGLKAHLVLVRTIELGRFDDPLPTFGYFNHVIVAVETDGKLVFLDPTCNACSYGILPHNIQGAHALVIREGENRLITLPVGQTQGNMRSAFSGISIDSRGTATVVDTMLFEGYYASMYREIFRDRSGKSPEELAKKHFFAHYPLAKVDDVELRGVERTAEGLTLLCRATIPGFIRPRSTVFLDPLIQGLAYGERQTDQRRYPLDLGKTRIGRYRMTLSVPADMEPISSPDSLEIDNGHFSYRAYWKTDGNRLVFNRVLNIDNGIVQPADYDTISAQLEEITEHENQKVVIRKTRQ